MTGSPGCPAPDPGVVVHPLAVRSHYVRVMLVRHGQVDSVRLVDQGGRQGVVVGVLEVEVNYRVSSSLVGQMTAIINQIS